MDLSGHPADARILSGKPGWVRSTAAAGVFFEDSPDTSAARKWNGNRTPDVNIRQQSPGGSTAAQE
jgi:hypothetical protein